MTGSYIEHIASGLINRLWEGRLIWFGLPPTSRQELLPIDLRLIARMLKLEIEEPEEIMDSFDSLTFSPLTNTAGIVDRPSRKIQVAQKFGPRVGRWTLAHEIGHYLLHKDLRHHRDRPTGPDFQTVKVKRPPREREADLFASNLLMPKEILREEFLLRFHGPVGGKVPNEDLAYWLSAGNGKIIDPCFLANQEPIYRARLVAKNKCFGGNLFESLADRFSVSIEAMAIRLVEIGFVT